MVYVTHDQVEAMTLADHIVVLQHGEVRRSARRSSSTTIRATCFVAGFIGSPTMNFLPATVTGIDEAGTIVQLAGGASVTVPVRPGSHRVGDNVTLGVRPEHLRVGGTGRDRG